MVIIKVQKALFAVKANLSIVKLANLELSNSIV